MIDIAPDDADVIIWTNEAVRAVPEAWQSAEKTIAFYDTVAYKRYALPSNFTRVNRVVEITQLLTANQASVETDTAGLAGSSVSGSHTFARVTDWACHGLAAAKITSSLAGTQDLEINTSWTLAGISPATLYAFAVRGKAAVAAGREWKAGIAWYDSDGTLISTDYGDAEPAPTTEACIRVEALAPVNAVYAAGVQKLVNAANGEMLWWDAAILYKTISDDAAEYSRYVVKDGKIWFRDPGHYEIRYLAWPTALTSLTDTVPLYDALEFALVKAICARYRHKDDRGDYVLWRAEWLADVADALNLVQTDSTPHQRRRGW